MSLGNDDPWVTRTMVGVMMGFVAPLIGCLINVLREWARDGRFWTLRERMAGKTDRASAEAELLLSVMEALRMRPMPQIVWRTVLATDRLGPAGRHAVDVNAGDIVVLGLVSGTQQSLQDCAGDAYLMFGGDRAGLHRPTHACPGRLTAMDALLGALTAMLTRRETMYPNGALAWRVEGAVDHVLVARPRLFDKSKAPLLPPKPSGRSGLVIAIGDSWVDGPYGSDLCSWLETFDWTVDTQLCSWRRFGEASTLHAKLAEIRRHVGTVISEAVRAQQKIAGVLISAGGNDSTKGVFEALLDHNDGDPATPALNAQRLATHVSTLRGLYEAILADIKQELDEYGVAAPLFVHGYDITPLPNNPLGYRPWFRKPFSNRNYDSTKHRTDQLKALSDLITAFDGQLASLSLDPSYSFVRHIKLNGTIARYWKTDQTDAWWDDLHPIKDGFYVLACEVDAALLKG